MSLDVRSRRIVCDDPKCGAAVNVSLENDALGARSSTASGWTFVQGALETRHFCPNCSTSAMGNRMAAAAR